MRLKFLKIVLLLLTLVPAVYAIYFISTLGDDFVGDEFDRLIVVHQYMMYLAWALMVLYIYFVFKLKNIKESRRALWAVTLFLGSLLAMPVFWFVHVWPDY